jgi:hypothetical protein
MQQDWFILTEAERTTAMGLIEPGGPEIDPRAVDGLSPGVGLNLNPDASGYAAGEPVALEGKYVQTRRIVTQSIPAYPEAMKTYLLTLPWASLDSDTIFIPPEP